MATNNALNNQRFNDFVISSSTAGITRTLTVSNTDNTNTASQAQLSLTTGGSSAGDASVQYAVTGTQTWTHGVDNSVANDPWKLSASSALGITDIIISQPTGEINYPLQPTFAAFLGSIDTNVTGNGAIFTLGSVTALTEIFDYGNNFNTNGTFTAPVSGAYRLSVGYLVQQASTGTNIDLVIRTTNRAWRGYQVDPSAINVGGGLGFNLSVLCDMDAGDTATTETFVVGVGANTVNVFGEPLNPRTWFSGNLVS